VPRFAPIVAALALLALAPGSAAAAVEKQTATLGNVSAEFSYDKVDEFDYRDVRIKITRGGAVLHDALVPAPCEDCRTMPQGFGDPENPALRIRNLDPGDEPEVLVDLYTGGAHCCLFTQIYSYKADTNSYRRTKGAWFDYGYELFDSGAFPDYELFRASDYRFAAAFTAYAASGSPPRVLQFKAGKFVNVTRKFRSLIKQNLKQQLELYKQYRGDDDLGDVRGWLAAYAADKYLLGQGDTAFDLINAAYRRGELNGVPGAGGPTGKKYISALRKFLTKTGYR
jgi:hypothetical protein